MTRRNDTDDILRASPSYVYAARLGARAGNPIEANRAKRPRSPQDGVVIVLYPERIETRQRRPAWLLGAWRWGLIACIVADLVFWALLIWRVMG